MLQKCPKRERTVKYFEETYHVIIAVSGGMYEYGENYEPREMSWKKKIYYGIFRVITVPIRKFL